MMHGHPAREKDWRPAGQQQQQQQQQQQVYRAHDFSAPQPAPPPGRQASCGASTAMSQMAIKQEPGVGGAAGFTATSQMAIKQEPGVGGAAGAVGAGYRPRSIAQAAPPADIDPDDLRTAEAVAAGLADTWRRSECTFLDGGEARFHEAARTLWSVAMFKSNLPRDAAAFDAAARHVRKTCAERFPDPLKELTTVCPGLTVMQQPKDTHLHRLYYGFDIENGRNFYSVAAVDIELKRYGFDVVNVARVAFRMIEGGAPSQNDRARYEQELKAGLYDTNKKLFERSKERRSAIAKKHRTGGGNVRVGA